MGKMSMSTNEYSISQFSIEQSGTKVRLKRGPGNTLPSLQIFKTLLGQKHRDLHAQKRERQTTIIKTPAVMQYKGEI